MLSTDTGLPEVPLVPLESTDTDDELANTQGEDCLDLFMDFDNPLGKPIHSSLKTKKLEQDQKTDVKKEKRRLERRRNKMNRAKEAAKDRQCQLTEQLNRLEARLDHFAVQIEDYKRGLLENLESERLRSKQLELDCEELQATLEKMEARLLQPLDFTYEPIIIKDPPSLKASFKLQAKNLHFEIFAMAKHKHLTNLRADQEEVKRKQSEREVRKLRNTISEMNFQISNIKANGLLTRRRKVSHNLRNVDQFSEDEGQKTPEVLSRKQTAKSKRKSATSPVAKL